MVPGYLLGPPDLDRRSRSFYQTLKTEKHSPLGFVLRGDRSNFRPSHLGLLRVSLPGRCHSGLRVGMALPANEGIDHREKSFLRPSAPPPPAGLSARILVYVRKCPVPH